MNTSNLTYRKVILSLFKGFSTFLSILSILFILVYFLSIKIPSLGYYPPEALIVYIMIMFVSVAARKVAIGMLDELKSQVRSTPNQKK